MVRCSWMMGLHGRGMMMKVFGIATVGTASLWRMRARFFLENYQARNKYLYAGSNHVCQQGGIHSTSLMTFHGGGGEQLNYRDAKNLVFVRDGDTVTLYVNIHNGGQYLNCERSHKKMYWNGETSHVKTKPEAYEFTVRKVTPGEKRSSVRTRSFRLGTMFSFNMNRKNPEDQSKYEGEVRSGTTPPGDSGQTQDGVLLPKELLKMGDIITLEHKARPGEYLLAKANSDFVHIRNTPCYFRLRTPQLRHLVHLNSSSNGSHMFTHLSEETRVDRLGKLSESEAQWLRLLQKLPHDIVYRILQYKGRWVRISRLVSRDWCKAAELHVHGIRVNGEFACISTTRERKQLIALIGRCKHLTHITLRNLDDMQENDVKVIGECKYLRRLALGGCRKLADGCIEVITGLQKLTHLNLAATAITDEGLELIATHLPSLECLNLYGCQYVSVYGVAKVLALPKLVSLNIRGTKLDKDTSEAMQHNHPGKQLLTGPLYIDGIYG
mmetsp:Transcript_13179/g.23618  ORF Transcript_13179/g.23618 Transcript_13179/m.23618 type:complete len:496 (+) Transcript_13179:93-1580(+)